MAFTETHTTGWTNGGAGQTKNYRWVYNLTCDETATLRYATPSIDLCFGDNRQTEPLRLRVSFKRTDALGTDLTAFEVHGADVDPGVDVDDTATGSPLTLMSDIIDLGSGTFDLSNTETQNVAPPPVIWSNGVTRFIAVAVHPPAVATTLTITITATYG